MKLSFVQERKLRRIRKAQGTQRSRRTCVPTRARHYHTQPCIASERLDMTKVSSLQAAFQAIDIERMLTLEIQA